MGARPNYARRHDDPVVQAQIRPVAEQMLASALTALTDALKAPQPNAWDNKYLPAVTGTGRPRANYDKDMANYWRRIAAISDAIMRARNMLKVDGAIIEDKEDDYAELIDSMNGLVDPAKLAELQEKLNRVVPPSDEDDE